jgi:Zn-dependent protease
MTDDAWQLPPQPEPAMPAPDLHPYPTLRERLKKFFAPLAAAGAFIVKFGAVLFKLKAFVFFGSAAVSVLAYAQLWGWKFALGFVLLILAHELGHVFALRLRGVRNSALVFVPLLGAFTAWRPTERSPYQEAETALAGPVLGTATSLVVAYIGHQRGSGLLQALAFIGLLINLFNLAPVPMLDGGRLTYLLRPSIWLLAIAGLVGWEFYRPGLFVLVLVGLAVYQLVHQLRDREGVYSSLAGSVTKSERNRISAIYLITVVAILIGMHATYAERHLR